VYINIPAEQKMDNVELNDAQLEAVAGGKAKLGYIINPIFPIDISFPSPPTLPPSDGDLSIK
jgi:hypothetical protein